MSHTATALRCDAKHCLCTASPVTEEEQRALAQSIRELVGEHRARTHQFLAALMSAQEAKAPLWWRLMAPDRSYKHYCPAHRPPPGVYGEPDLLGTLYPPAGDAAPRAV